MGPLRPPQCEHPTPFGERQAGDRRSHCQIRNRGALVENAIVLKSWRLARPPTWSTGLASCANTRIVVHMRYFQFGITCSERLATHRNSSSSLRFTGRINRFGTACRKSRMSAVRVTARLLRLLGGAAASLHCACVCAHLQIQIRRQTQRGRCNQPGAPAARAPQLLAGRRNPVRL